MWNNEISVKKTADFFWEKRAHRVGFSSGYRDPIVEDLEWRALHAVCQDLLPDSSRMDMLEIGCHVGYTTKRLYELLRPKSYVALDISRNSIDKANQYKNEYGFDQVQFCVGSAINMERAAETVDVLFSIRCIQNIRDTGAQRKALEEIGRVLRTGGKAIIVENTFESFESINKLRATAGLPKLTMPVHTVYVPADLYGSDKDVFSSREEYHFAAAYYFGTRYAKWLMRDADPNNLQDTFNQFFRDIDQGLFVLPLGPSIFVLRK